MPARMVHWVFVVVVVLLLHVLSQSRFRLV